MMGIFSKDHAPEYRPFAVPANEFIKFQGAIMDVDDEGRIVDYVPRGEILINAAQICAAYDHTIMVMGHKIRVMESLEEITQKLRGRPL